MATGASQIFVEQVREAALILGIGTPAAKAYMLASMSAQTSNFTPPDHIEFNSVLDVDASGAIALSVGAGQLAGLITLGVNRTYLITAQVSTEFLGATGAFAYSWRNNTAAADIGTRGSQKPQTHISSTAEQGIATAIVVVGATPQEIELRIRSASSVFAIRALDESFFSVIEID